MEKANIENNLKLRLIEKSEDCFSRAKSTSDPLESEKWNQAGIKLLEEASEIEKNEKNLELEREKYESSKNWKDPKFLIATGAPIIILILDKVIDRDTMWKFLKATFEFEKDNTYTSIPGRGLSGAFRIPAIFKRSR